MATQSLLYQTDVPVNEWLRIRIPTVGEIIDREDEYYGMVSVITAMPIDMMVQLDDIGIDFTDITEWDLFLLLFSHLAEQNTDLVFGDLNLTGFRPMINPQNGLVVLRDDSTGACIDRSVHSRMAGVLRKIHHLEKNRKKPGNDEAKAYMLERARIKMRRNKNRTQPSQLEELIIAMVNTEQFRYGYAEVRDLTIYQFNESVRQIIHKVDYDNRMHGVYAGTVSSKDLSQDDLNWLKHK